MTGHGRTYRDTPTAARHLRVVAHDAAGVRVVVARFTPDRYRAGHAYAMRWRAGGTYRVTATPYADTGVMHGPCRPPTPTPTRTTPDPAACPHATRTAPPMTTPTNGPTMTTTHPYDPTPGSPYAARVVTGRDDAAVTPDNPNGTTYGDTTYRGTRDAAIAAALGVGGTVDVFHMHARVARVHADGGVDHIAR